MNARVVLAYTKVRPGVREALAATGAEWDEVETVGSTGYYDLMADLWRSQRDVIIVEHDVIVRPDSLAELDACARDWCAFPTPYLQGDYAGLSCTKFSGQLMRLVSGAVDRAGLMSNDKHPPRHWCTLDAFLRVQLMRSGMVQHRHEPALGHYRDYGGIPQPAHGCSAVPMEERR